MTADDAAESMFALFTVHSTTKHDGSPFAVVKSVECAQFKQVIPTNLCVFKVSELAVARRTGHLLLSSSAKRKCREDAVCERRRVTAQIRVGDHATLH